MLDVFLFFFCLKNKQKTLKSSMALKEIIKKSTQLADFKNDCYNTEILDLK